MQETERGYPKTIEEVRNLWLDPECPESSVELSKLASMSSRIVAEFYASKGRRDLISQSSQNWLESGSIKPSKLEEITRKILVEEAGTRRFDERFMGQIHPQGNVIGIVANLIAAQVNTNTIVREVSYAENRMECEVLDWLADLFGYDKTRYSGNLTVGGTTANMAALWAARESTKERLKQEGRWRRDIKLVVLGTEMAHYSVSKASRMQGTVFAQTQSAGFKTNPDAMLKTIEAIRKAGNEVSAIVALAGETETGLVDNLAALADLADKTGVYLHVDAAYGGPYVMSRAEHLFEGINRADSITVDPHKQMYVPYAAGAVLFRDKAHHMLIEKDMRRRARYLLRNESRERSMEEDENRNFGFSRVEGSMGSAGAIATWATIKLLGKDGFRALLDHTLDLTNYAYEKVQSSPLLRPLHQPETNTLLIGLNKGVVRGKEQHRNIILTARDRADFSYGYYVSVNEEVDNGNAAFRLVPTHPFTTRQHVKELISILETEIKGQL